MTRDEAIAIIQQGLGFRTDLVAQSATAMDRAIKEFEGPHRTLPKFLIEEDDTIALLAGVRNFTLPNGFLRMVEDDGRPGYTSSEGERIFLERQDYTKAEKFFVGMDPGRPRAYVVRQNSLRFYPEPDVDYDLTWSWYKSDPLPTSGTNGWLTKWPYLVIGRAGMFLAEDTQQVSGDDSAYTRFSKMYGDWNRIWVSQVAAEEDDNAPKAMGTNY